MAPATQHAPESNGMQADNMQPEHALHTEAACKPGRLTCTLAVGCTQVVALSLRA